jgi:hypothetical protein
MAKEQDLLKPILFEDLDIEQILDSEGRVVGFERRADELDPLRKEIEHGFLKRTRAALAGELPVNPSLIRELDEADATLRERLRGQLGTGWETTTPGREALDKARRTRSELLESARKGDLTLAEQLGLAREEANRVRQQAFAGSALGTVQANLPITERFGQSASFFGQAGDSWARDRDLQLRASLGQAQLSAQLASARAQTLSGLFGAIGQGAGLATGLGIR